MGRDGEGDKKEMKGWKERGKICRTDVKLISTPLAFPTMHTHNESKNAHKSRSRFTFGVILQPQLRVLSRALKLPKSFMQTALFYYDKELTTKRAFCVNTIFHQWYIAAHCFVLPRPRNNSFTRLVSARPRFRITVKAHQRASIFFFVNLLLVMSVSGNFHCVRSD